MMNQSALTLHALPKISMREKKRVGRGYGSGKGGHTSGRGQKGQKSRRTIPWSFEGGALPLSRRLPFMRGKGRLHSLKQKRVILNIGDFEKCKDGAIIDIEFLKKEGYVDSDKAMVRGVKILGRGKLTKKLTISGLVVSMPAKAKIEKAGGEIQELREEGRGKKEEGMQAEKTVKMVKAVKKVEEKKSVERKPIKKPVARKPSSKVVKKVMKRISSKKKTAKKA